MYPAANRGPCADEAVRRIGGLAGRNSAPIAGAGSALAAGVTGWLVAHLITYYLIPAERGSARIWELSPRHV